MSHKFRKMSQHVTTPRQTKFKRATQGLEANNMNSYYSWTIQLGFDLFKMSLAFGHAFKTPDIPGQTSFQRLSKKTSLT